MEIRSYWQQLQPREQKLLQLLGAVIVLLLVYSLIISPFIASKAQLQQDLQSRRALLETVNNAAMQKQRLGGTVAARPGNKNADIMKTVRTTINQQQLTASMKSIKEKGRSNLSVKFDDVSYDAINTWLMSLAQQHGIKVVSLQATDKGSNNGRVDLVVELGQ